MSIDHRKRRFVRELALFLVEDQAAMSAKLQMNDPAAVAWSRVRANTPLFGYPTVEQAELELAEWLGIELPKPPAVVYKEIVGDPGDEVEEVDN